MHGDELEFDICLQCGINFKLKRQHCITEEKLTLIIGNFLVDYGERMGSVVKHVFAAFIGAKHDLKLFEL
jgi:hypothetical protein